MSDYSDRNFVIWRAGISLKYLVTKKKGNTIHTLCYYLWYLDFVSFFAFSWLSVTYSELRSQTEFRKNWDYLKYKVLKLCDILFSTLITPPSDGIHQLNPQYYLYLHQAPSSMDSITRQFVWISLFKCYCELARTHDTPARVFRSCISDGRGVANAKQEWGFDV